MGETSGIIDGGTTCLPKTCVVDCRFLHLFDDILMSNRLNTGRVYVVGELPIEHLQSICDTVQASKVLERNKKPAIIEALRARLNRP